MDVELFTYKDGYAGTHFKETRPATDEEIKAAHPVCRDCKHYGPNIPSAYNECTHRHSAYYDLELIGMSINPDQDYCRHWEAKT